MDVNDRAIAALARADAVLDDDIDLLTVQEYAARFRLHIQTVYSAIRYKRFAFKVIRVARGSIRIIVPRESINPRKTA